jgi:hypothetical protein
VPVQITPFSLFPDETLRDPSSDVTKYFVATIASTIPSPSRSFTGPIRDFTWLSEESPCLYVGDVQAFRIREVNAITRANTPTKVNDGVIEFFFTEYIVSGPFEDDFMFGMFDPSMCMVPHAN